MVKGGRDATGAETGEEEEAGPQCDKLAVVHGTAKKERRRERGSQDSTSVKPVKLQRLTEG